MYRVWPVQVNSVPTKALCTHIADLGSHVSKYSIFDLSAGLDQLGSS